MSAIYEDLKNITFNLLPLPSTNLALKRAFEEEYAFMYNH
jgi:hypothetical protein